MILSGFSNPTALQGNGIIIGGKKYMTLRVEDVCIQGKLGAGGVSIARSMKCEWLRAISFSYSCSSGSLARARTHAHNTHTRAHTHTHTHTHVSTRQRSKSGSFQRKNRGQFAPNKVGTLGARNSFSVAEAKGVKWALNHTCCRVHSFTFGNTPSILPSHIELCARTVLLISTNEAQA